MVEKRNQISFHWLIGSTRCTFKIFQPFLHEIIFATVSYKVSNVGGNANTQSSVISFHFVVIPEEKIAKSGLSNFCVFTVIIVLIPQLILRNKFLYITIMFKISN